MNIKSKNLNKYYGKKHILNNFNFELNQGQITAIIGSNGAGKTTLLKCISTLITPESGQITLKDKTYEYHYNRSSDLKNIRTYISSLIGGTDILYNNLTVIENIKFFLSLKKVKLDYTKMNYYLNLFEIMEYKNSKVTKLSKGSRQKILLLINLLSDCKILIFDEPTIGLDIISINKFKDELKRISKHKIILISSHDLDLVSDIANKIMFIDKGSLVCKTSRNNLYDKELIRLSITLDNLIDDNLFQYLKKLYPENIKFNTNTIEFTGEKKHIHNIFCSIVNSSNNIIDINTHDSLDLCIENFLNSKAVNK